jgi:hypothetical protein
MAEGMGWIVFANKKCEQMKTTGLNKVNAAKTDTKSEQMSENMSEQNSPRQKTHTNTNANTNTDNAKNK